MPAPINVELRGYLDFFRVRNGGRNPQITGEVMQPTMDVERWYLESQVVEYEITYANITGVNQDADVIPITATAPTNLANGSQLQVPQHEVWMLLPGTWVSASGNLVASQTVRLGLSTARTPASDQVVTVPLRAEGWDTFNATVVFSAMWVLEAPFFIRPGAYIFVRNYGATVGGSTIFTGGVLRLVRLRS